MTDPDIRRAVTPVSLEAAMVARMYFIDDRQKNDIAQELGISRFKVARLLEDARAAGIVRITVDMPAEIDLPLGDRVARAFGIQRAIVVRTLESAVGSTPTTTGALLGRAAADYLTTLRPGGELGISWGSTLTSVVDAAETLPAVDVVQLVGGSTNVHLPDSGVELVRRLSQKTGGRAFPLHAPLLVRTAGMAEQLRDEPSLSEVFDRFDRLDAALVGVGSWHPAGSSLLAELSQAERDELLAQGAAADVCSLVFDDAGAAIDSPALHRTIGITADQLRRVPDVIAVAGGPHKVGALGAVLRSGVVNTLVTDSQSAATLLLG